ncbi:winged helix-turn-helix domain-containing protein [Candidatus Bathyarchaeota archaeon]|nr:winged helix-turn-helix domain-containing protein [Candidatus Bathyarchaeota archaeon]
MNIDNFEYKSVVGDREFSKDMSILEGGKSATESCNFYYGGSVDKLNAKMGKILEVLQKSEYSLTPKEIAFRTGLKYGTVKSYLRRMVKLGLIVQVARGLYSCKTHLRCGCVGVGGFICGVPRVHNLRLRLRVGGVVVPSVVVCRVVGGCRVRVCFGSKRGLVTGVVACDDGLDYYGCRLAVELFKEVVRRVLGLEVRDEDIEVASVEVNEDYAGIRLDGLKAVTVKYFTGALERIYNKGHGVRSEVKVKPESLESMWSLLKGGMPAYLGVQGVFYVGKQLERLVKAIQFQNRGIQQLQNLLIERLPPASNVSFGATVSYRSASAVASGSLLNFRRADGEPLHLATAAFATASFGGGGV